MNEKLISRLADLGYTYNPETDEGLLEFCLNAIANRIMNRINDSTIPEGLEHIEIDMTCGEFLKMKKSMGQLTTYTFEQIANTIKEGDTQITFQSGATPEQQFDAYINNMINGHEEDYIRYRKMVW